MIVGRTVVEAPVAEKLAALTALGVPPGDIARVHRPIGLNIGSDGLCPVPAAHSSGTTTS